MGEQSHKYYDVLIADFDGTIADTGKIISESMIKALESIGITNIDPEALEYTHGLPFKDAINMLVDAEVSLLPAVAMETFYKELENRSLQKPSLFPGVMDTLRALHNRGIKIAITSNRRSSDLQKVIEAWDLAPLIDAWVCNDVAADMPLPAMAQYLLKELGVEDSSHALVVGSTTHCIEMTRRAGADSVAATYGTHSERMLKFFRPNYLIHSFNEVLSLTAN